MAVKEFLTPIIMTNLGMVVPWWIKSLDGHCLAILLVN